VEGELVATVHGDVQPSNVFVRASAVGTADVSTSDIMFVSFQRAGFQGISRYDSVPLNPIPPGRQVQRSALMYVREDVEQMKTTADWS